MKKRTKKEDGSILEPQFKDEDAAREWLEKKRWPDGAVCPHCGLIGEAWRITVKEKTPEQIEELEKAAKKAGKKYRVRKPRKGLWQCRGCRKQFTVTVKTIFEDSHIPLHKWLLAFHLINASKKGMSAHQLMRMLDLKEYKSAWFMAHRIRYCLTGELPEKMSGIIEADETYIGGSVKNKSKQQRHVMRVQPGKRMQDYPAVLGDKAAVFSVVQRGGRVHSRHVEKVTADNLKAVLDDVCQMDAHLITDTGMLRNRTTGRRKHSLVNHRADEYVRFEEGVMVTTNTVEGFFSLLKRGINGIYHHVGRKHLHRYLAEFDFRYNHREISDGERANEALKGIEGRRLTYKGANAQN
ncbi:MAG TPA: IS1595 family transposase [Pyrinomonadaceae bacterium]|jgi:transposase-like protein|nr:IS1595 family transposase [Pyrinomonadaceae bacterium]